jgi:hypothetical protein
LQSLLGFGVLSLSHNYINVGCGFSPANKYHLKTISWAKCPAYRALLACTFFKKPI